MSSVGKGFAYLFTSLFALVFIVINLVGIFFVFSLLTNVAFAAEPSQANKICLGCHQEQEEYLVTGGVHEKLNCTTCHNSNQTFPHPAGINSAQEIQTACQACHAQAAQEYTNSVHGSELSQLEKEPMCSSCHGSHDIFKIENPEAKHNRINVNETCKSCHGGRVLDGYNWSFHGIAFNSGYTEAANCVDCHGSHAVLPEGNPASMVSVANRPETCAKCHQTARENFALGAEHVTPDDKVNALPLYITLQVFIILIIIDATKDSSIAIFDLLKKLRSKKTNKDQEKSRGLD